MRKHYLILLATLFFTGNILANPVTKENAQQIANQWHQQEQGFRQKPAMQKSQNAVEAAVPLRHLYVYNFGENDGFVVVAGDDETRSQILGYSNEGHFDWNTIGEEMQWWLSQYEEQIEYIENNKGIKTQIEYIENNKRIKTENGLSIKRTPLQKTAKSVAPLIQTAWGQKFPYYNNCPVVNDTTCVTGCVATAWGMLCKYHQYPSSAKFSYSYTWDKQNTTRSGSVNSTYNYANMRLKYATSKANSNYGTAAERDEVAKLIGDIGNNVGMDYGTTASGANSLGALGAMVANYGFDPAARQIQRKYFDDAQWEALLRAELDAGRVVEYNGTKPTGGSHAFLCDGYDEKGLFHFNFGWSEIPTVYYVTSAVDYSNSQYAMIGIQPAQTGSVTGSSMGSTSSFASYTAGSTTTFLYPTNFTTSVHSACTVQVAVCAENCATHAMTYGTVSTYSFSGKGNWSYKSGSKLTHTATLADGTYKFYPVYRTKGATEWRKVDFAPGYQSFLQIRVSKGQRSFVVDDFMAGGHTYKVIDSENNYVKLVKGGCADTIKISSTVTYNSTKYTVTEIGDSAFYGCTSTTYLQIINDKLERIGNYAFANCHKLRNVYFGFATIEDATPNNGIFLNAGSEQDSLIILFPSSTEQIPAYIFCPDGGNNAPNIKKVTINYASSKSACTEIHDYAFYGLTELSAIALPKALTFIGKEAFGACTNLATITNYAYCPPVTSAGAICMAKKPTAKFQCMNSYNAYMKNPYGVWNLFTKSAMLNSTCKEEFSCDAPVTGLEVVDQEKPEIEKMIRNGEIIIRVGELYYNMLGEQL